MTTKCLIKINCIRRNQHEPRTVCVIVLRISFSLSLPPVGLWLHRYDRTFRRKNATLVFAVKSTTHRHRSLNIPHSFELHATDMARHRRTQNVTHKRSNRGSVIQHVFPKNCYRNKSGGKTNKQWPSTIRAIELIK